MTREEKLKEEFRMFCAIAPKTMVVDADNIFNILKMGMEWADQHPRKGLWDAEKVCKYLENHAGNYMTLENDEEGELQSVFYQKGLIEDLRKAMEE